MTTMHEVLRAGAAAHGDRPAVLFGDETASYSGLLDAAERFAAGLAHLGLGGNDSVATLLDNSLDTVRAWFGVALLGAADVPINPDYTGELLAYLLADSGATAVICEASYLGAVADLLPRLPALRLIVVRGNAAAVDLPCRMVRFAEVDAPPGETVSGAAERVVLYTSGTTGPSKGVVHTQRSCLNLARYNARSLAYGPEDRLLNFFPLYHQNARYTGVLPALISGARIRLEPRFRSSTFWQICHDDGITAFNYLGSVLRLILNVTPPDWGPDRHSLRKAFGAGAVPGAWAEFEERLGIRLVETYGLSEAPMATINSAFIGCTAPMGSAGRAGDLFEVAVVDAADRLMPPDTIGQIVMRPRGPDALMLGYLNKDAATVAAFRNLWFHSGDRGRLSADGFLYFEERDKDAIRRRGENISAWEVESVLDRHPDVVETAVFGVRSDEADEEVAAAIVLRTADADLAAILAFAAQRLPRHAVPAYLRVMEELPRTATEKVQKAELRRAGREACLSAAEIRSAAPSDRA